MAGPQGTQHASDQGGSQYTYPLTEGSGFDGSVADHGNRAMGNWQSDNAVDISCPVHTGVCAVADGRIGRVTPDTSYDPGGNPNGDSVYLHCGGDQFWYTHLIETHVQEGDNVRAGFVIGESGTANSVDHLHFAADPSNAGDASNPELVVEGASIGSGGGGSTSGSGGIGGISEGDLFAIGRSAAMSSQFQLEGVLNHQETIMMEGSKSIYNDEALMPFVQDICKASLRHFQSLPNGNFFAFFPDYFGAYGHRKPYWKIDNVEITDGQMEITDDSLATHVFVAGDTYNLSGSVELNERIQSKGVITIYDAFNSSMVHTDKHPEKPNLKGFEEATNFLRRYGVRPHIEEATFIRNPAFEVFYAFTQFQTLWANQYRTQMSLTFMPELYPGGIVAFEDHGFQAYVDSVTHSFNYDSGFTTEVNFTAPAALPGTESQVAEGMAQPFTQNYEESKNGASSTSG